MAPIQHLLQVSIIFLHRWIQYAYTICKFWVIIAGFKPLGFWSTMHRVCEESILSSECPHVSCSCSEWGEVVSFTSFVIGFSGHGNGVLLLVWLIHLNCMPFVGVEQFLFPMDGCVPFFMCIFLLLSTQHFWLMGVIALRMPYVLDLYLQYRW